MLLKQSEGVSFYMDLEWFIWYIFFVDFAFCLLTRVQIIRLSSYLFSCLNQHKNVWQCMVITHSKRKDQPGKVANPVRGQMKAHHESDLKALRML